jgi:hypothetical protein
MYQGASLDAGRSRHVYLILFGVSTCGPSQSAIAASPKVAREAVLPKVGGLSVGANPHVLNIIVNREGHAGLLCMELVFDVSRLLGFGWCVQHVGSS